MSLEKQYHLIIPAMHGHDSEQPDKDYTSVEEIASSMGGVATRMLAMREIDTEYAVIDAGMTPYQLSKFLTYIVIKKRYCPN